MSENTLAVIDKVTSAQRSAMMAAVKNKDTEPELAVRKRVFAAGFRYRLHVRKLPGTSDLVLPRYRVAVFVHGCFWHGHDCPKGKFPATNRDFWREKSPRKSNATDGWSKPWSATAGRLSPFGPAALRKG